MIEMKFSKAVVVETLTANLKEHRVIFAEAVEGYREEARKQLDEAIERLKAGAGPVNVYVMVSAPENHETDYEAVISMLEHSLDTEITFNDNQYRCYMLDQWDWQHQFLASNSVYSATAVTKAGSF